MKPFDFQRADTVPDALGKLAPGGAYLAGGTNLVDHLRAGIREVDQIVDVSRLDLTEITETSGGSVRVGAMVKNSDMAAHPFIRERYPMLSEALLAAASGQIRNMATTGGNLLQRTRCVYFYDPTTPCNKREPGTGCSAIAGFGKYNALFGASEHCVTTHPSDMCVALAALDAVVVVEGQGGERRIPFAEFHRLPGDTPEIDTNLRGGELITAVELPPVPVAAHSTYRKVRERASYAFALVSVAGALHLEGGNVKEVRLAFGGVAHKPWRAQKAEAYLTGRPATPENFRAAIEAELADAQTGPENAFKVPMLRNTVISVLEELVENRTAQRRAEQGGAA
ncbi:FAD binding domain-containing protein [Deinococcus radiodurans]|uniref:Oxidoreductase n=1 Tax=Deinococcus radiodurans (strain ATCC 13939 / DSM 20539 / JCM 16871 / CCUG 27074 / LMG 4051 / NBRC 15346 / NCIMB 9279 / VKM B-1422 / R1) TaxID=243230 RepID=Q9RYS2_DEIRA|nr:xanthine dehydrogenase family protein subunit M [Deinococcus radiodurans]AAF12401.1 oxidoreductase [Deinococcus radiodurans R1 = ATCC 13939 = DSM 20539]ANC73083.1 molybdopterin dehydrogenase [Deinococcus radiodurans R1 = ATCC 13939 = DSM 20539]QEM73038.1 xanthine dehydrogenase family protein subunit M [Deinococcus radiodurans]QIP30283.1 xanthine dehydrogenase family protein subunit M [Deinococcus radiodurans]QIP33360.1 xanthine dehydrogenase family protein subunit M [Deinococcus radiodurans